MKRLLVGAAIALAIVSSIAESAQAAPDASDAEALFKSAKTLRDAGKVAEACAAFEQSKQLAPGVGVTLYLADCYERLGRTASAWARFREAEERARERKDKRVEVAHAHAATLQSKVNRLVVVVAPSVAVSGAQLRVDDAGPIPESDWTTGVAVDPGDHVITLSVPGAAPRVAKAHVDAAVPFVTVTLDAPAPSPLPLVAPVARPPSPAALPMAPVETTGHGDLPSRRVAEYGLLGVGAVGIGLGAAFLAMKNQSMTNDPGGAPQVDQSAAIASTVAFAAGGAALVSAIVLYLSAPDEKESALVVAPAPMIGGAGAFLRGSF